MLLQTCLASAGAPDGVAVAGVPYVAVDPAADNAVAAASVYIASAFPAFLPPAVVEFPFCCWRPCCCSCFRPCRCRRLVLAVDPLLSMFNTSLAVPIVSLFSVVLRCCLSPGCCIQHCCSRQPCCFSTSAIAGTPAVAGTFYVSGINAVFASTIADAQMPMHVVSSKRLTVWMHIIKSYTLFVQCMYFKMLTQSRAAFVELFYLIYIYQNCISGFLSHLENRRISDERKSDWKNGKKWISDKETWRKLAMQTPRN